MDDREKLEMARRLRAEAEHLRRHGLTNLFEHTFACVHYGQVSKELGEERCGNCPLQPYVLPEYQDEAFPCQHITEEGWNRAADQPGMAERYADWLLHRAMELEAKCATAPR
jgi:hypothetical protein